MTEEQYQSTQPQKQKSAMAIAGLILGIVALLISFIPIINNVSFFLALLGLIFAIVGLISTGANGKRSGRALAIAALVICLVSGAIVLGTQSLYSAAIDSVTSGASLTSTSNTTDTSSGSAADSSSSENASSQNSATTELGVGQSATFDNGLTISVAEIKNVTNYDGSTLVGAYIEYSNSGSQGASYNLYDWKGETSTGSQEYTTYYSGDSSDTLNSGTLAAGGTVSGWVYFKEGTVKALYFSNMMSNEPSATWTL